MKTYNLLIENPVNMLFGEDFAGYLRNNRLRN